VASSTTPEVEAIVRAVVAMGRSDPSVAEASRRFWSGRLELAGEIVERAILRGELPPHTDAKLVVEAIIAAIYFRLLMSGGTLDARFLGAVADLVTVGAEARPGPGPRAPAFAGRSSAGREPPGGAGAPR
jgi:hypothetical protein